jgi:hypothetical protein
MHSWPEPVPSPPNDLQLNASPALTSGTTAHSPVEAEKTAMLELGCQQITDNARDRRRFFYIRQSEPNGARGNLSRGVTTVSPYWYVRGRPTLPYQALVVLEYRIRGRKSF